MGGKVWDMSRMGYKVNGDSDIGPSKRGNTKYGELTNRLYTAGENVERTGGN